MRDEVSLALGPPDPTIIIEEEGDGEGKSLTIQDLLEQFKAFGEIVLVRYVCGGTAGYGCLHGYWEL